MNVNYHSSIQIREQPQKFIGAVIPDFHQVTGVNEQKIAGLEFACKLGDRRFFHTLDSDLVRKPRDIRSRVWINGNDLG